jgi:hypothetical protein
MQDMHLYLAQVAGGIFCFPLAHVWASSSRCSMPIHASNPEISIHNASLSMSFIAVYSLDVKIALG